MVWQYIIICVVLAVSVGYAVWRIYKALHVKPGDPCYGCALKDVCRRNAYCGKETQRIGKSANKS